MGHGAPRFPSGVEEGCPEQTSSMLHARIPTTVRHDSSDLFCYNIEYMKIKQRTYNLNREMAFSEVARFVGSSEVDSFPICDIYTIGFSHFVVTRFTRICRTVDFW